MGWQGPLTCGESTAGSPTDTCYVFSSTGRHPPIAVTHAEPTGEKPASDAWAVLPGPSPALTAFAQIYPKDATQAKEANSGKNQHGYLLDFLRA